MFESLGEPAEFYVWYGTLTSNWTAGMITHTNLCGSDSFLSEQDTTTIPGTLKKFE